MMILSSVLILLCGTLINVKNARSEDCNTDYNLKHYEELNCTPQREGDNGCITSYNCSFTNGQKKDKCYYQGREFSVGDRLKSKDFKGNCIPTCTCSDNYGRAEFNCAHYDCPEFFQPPLKQNCMRTYSHDRCCAVGVYCKDDQEKPPATCEYGGQVYTEGAAFYPDEKPCKKCICKPGFNGVIESPWCEDIFCEIEIHYSKNIQDNCAPVYYGRNSCCPIYFHCEEDISTEGIEESSVETSTITQKVNENSPKCKFGNSTVEIGRTVPGPQECVECKCKIPPLVDCMVNTECEEKKSSRTKV